MKVRFLSGCVADRGYLVAPIEHPSEEDKPPDRKSEFPKIQKSVKSLLIHYETEARPEVISEQQQMRFKREQGMNYNKELTTTM